MKFVTRFFTLALIAVIAFGCEKEIITPEQASSPAIALSGAEALIRPDVQCGTSRFSDLKDDIGADYGSIEILNDADNIYILIEMEQGKFLDAVQVYFGTQAQIPNDGNGNITMEDFQFQSVISRGAAMYTVIMPIGSLPSCTDIVLWAQCSEKNMFGQTTNSSETWMTGIPIYDGSFYKYCLGSCGNNFAQQDDVNN